MMTRGHNDRDRLGQLASVAASCSGAEEFRGEILAWIGRHIGVDGALLVQLEGERPAGRSAIGLDRAWVDRFVAGLTTSYRADFEGIKATLADGTFMSGAGSR